MSNYPDHHQAELEALSRSLSQSYEELALLHRINERMRVTQKPETFFGQLCQELREVVDAESVQVLCTERDGPPGLIHLLASAGPLQLTSTQHELLWRHTEQEMTDHSWVLIDSHVDGPFRYDWPGSITSLMSVPIRSGPTVRGVLAAFNKVHKPDFDSLDAQLLLSLANESAVYLDNFRLYQDMQDLLIGSLRALTSSIDAKDRYTCGHSERVALIAKWLAQRLSLSTPDVNTVYLAGLLHDVGKIGVSEAVLCKPGRLGVEEFEQIKKHPEIGANILSGIRQMAGVARGVLAHHERYDGSGYPQGLHGREIPLTGRIVMLADSFDAMISDRTYRQALPLTAAKVEIRRFGGTQFDPDVSDAFLDSDLTDLVSQLHAIPTHRPGAQSLYTPILN